jgi:hypothetical protein
MSLLPAAALVAGWMLPFAAVKVQDIHRRVLQLKCAVISGARHLPYVCHGEPSSVFLC